MKSFIDKVKKKIRVGSFFGATSYELENFFCGIGEAEILKSSITITDYPFEPSKVFPHKEIKASKIDEVHLNEYPPTIKIENELIFISRELIEELTAFAKRNNTETIKRQSNWDRITEPFVDTEFDDNQKANTIKHLTENGFTKKEIIELREEVGEQMNKYNFDTMLWEWGFLGLSDVLSAMRVKLSKEEFEEFYWRAMEIEQRKTFD